ncbi:hypothetical protein F2Q69_00049804 [Brassica cretica]|uniref:Uncharacterized protein n=1 Tax=Brassica cretica TaxID=69181 RepID=A0A8S9PNQ1_BRACR|nr:hypothetical protein F2Q69_00049804 [Brassica cretica]
MDNRRSSQKSTRWSKVNPVNSDPSRSTLDQIEIEMNQSSPTESTAESPAVEKGRRLTGINGGDGKPRVVVAREPHARNVAGQKWRVTVRPSDSPADLPGPDSSRRHSHDGGLKITKFQTDDFRLPSAVNGDWLAVPISVDGDTDGTDSDLLDGSDSAGFRRSETL